MGCTIAVLKPDTDVTVAELADELFCVRYELASFAGEIAGFGLERWMPGFTHVSVHEEHMQRYAFACERSRQKKVLDIACGAGRGSRMLCEEGQAAAVTACDVDEQAVRYARIRNRHARAMYRVGDGQALGFSGEFDLAVSFETIEHVRDAKAFVKGIARALKPGGRLVISTPVSHHRIDEQPANRFHVREWNIAAFRELLESAFVVRHTYLQYQPAWHPSLWQRVAAKVRGVAMQPPRPASVRPIWLEYVGQPLPASSIAYQIVECDAQ